MVIRFIQLIFCCCHSFGCYFHGYTRYWQCFKNFYGFSNSLMYIPLEMGNKVKKILSSEYSV